MSMSSLITSFSHFVDILKANDNDLINQILLLGALLSDNLINIDESFFFV